MTRTEYQIVAYPHGERTVVATLYGLNDYNKLQLEVAARVAGVSIGDDTEPMIKAAQVQAQMRDEYVDLLRDGDHIATVGPEGMVS